MAGLEEPLIPQYSNTGVDNFIRGFSAVAAANTKREHENELAQQLILKRQMDQQNFLLKSQIASGQYENQKIQAEAAQTRAEAYGEHVSNELEKQKRIAGDTKGLAGAMAEADSKYELGSKAMVQAYEKAQSDYYDAAQNVYGNRLFKPKYDEATREYNAQHTRFRQDNKDIFGNSISDPWSDNPAWTQDKDGPTKGHWRFPVWEYAAVQKKDAQGNVIGMESMPVHKKDVIMSDADKKSMQHRYNQYIRGDSSLPSPKSAVSGMSLKESAQLALDDPDATASEKAAAQRIINGN